MKHLALGDDVTRKALVARYRCFRERSRQLFEIPVSDAYCARPIALRNPIVFYEGHLPAFAVNTLAKLALGRPGVDEQLEVLFARGIDPPSPDQVRDPREGWPSRAEVRAYAEAADQSIAQILREATLERDDVPQLRGGEAVLAILEHELMHQETMLYILHNLPYDQKIARGPLGGNEVTLPVGREAMAERGSALPEMIRIPAGAVTLGASREAIGFGWDNEFPECRVDVGEFEIAQHSVTNAGYLEFIEAQGVAAPHFWLRHDGAWYWRGMFELIPLPPQWPVYVTLREAQAYAEWRGMRIATEAEYHRAAFGTPSGEERQYPWGEQRPHAAHGNFGFTRWDPAPVGSFPEGASAWGVHDLVGNGWEWTSTTFGGFPGFEPMPSYPVYSSEFFGKGHYVLKGASPGTSPELIRRSFRNWFRPDYPFVYAKFRLARDP